MSPSLERHLKQKDIRKDNKRKYEATPERKKKRQKVQREKMNIEIKKQIADYNRGATYGTGIALETEDSLPSFVVENEQKLKKLKSQRCPLPGCFGRNHTTSASKACNYYDCGSDEEFLGKLKSYLKATYPDKYGKYRK